MHGIESQGKLGQKISVFVKNLKKKKKRKKEEELPLPSPSLFLLLSPYVQMVTWKLSQDLACAGLLLCQRHSEGGGIVLTNWRLQNPKGLNVTCCLCKLSLRNCSNHWSGRVRTNQWLGRGEVCLSGIHASLTLSLARERKVGMGVGSVAGWGRHWVILKALP